MTKEEAIRRIKSWNLDSDDMEVLSVVIPELAESEDEKVRKELLEVIKLCYRDGGYTLRTDDYKKYLAYLEKQKEQKNFQTKVQQRMEYLWDKLPDSHKVENGDCTPEEWKTLGAYMELEMNFDEDGFVKQKEQKPAEWSEDDADFINMLILHFNYLINKGGDSVETYKSYREKLKSLRPQPHCKPSEEQMEALNEVINTLAASKHPHESDYLFNRLNGLRKNLKKL